MFAAAAAAAAARGGRGLAQVHGLLAAQDGAGCGGEVQGVVLAGVYQQCAAGNQLAQYAAQLRLAHVGSKAKGADVLVAKLLHFFGVFAAHYVHDVACAKRYAAELLHAVDG